MSEGNFSLEKHELEVLARAKRKILDSCIGLVTVDPRKKTYTIVIDQATWHTIFRTKRANELNINP